MLDRELAKAFHELAPGRNDARLALHGLEHDRGGLRPDERTDALEVIEACLAEAAHLRREHRVPARLARRGHHRERAAVERILESDDLEGAIAADAPPLARELDCPLVGLGAAAREEDPIEAG